MRNGKPGFLAAFSSLLAVTVLIIMYLANAFNTYAILCDGNVMIISTLSENVDDVVAQAGVKLGKDDRVILRSSEGDDGFTFIEIVRRFEISVTVDGQTHVMPTTGGTVGALLHEVGVVLSEYDEVEPQIDRLVLAPMAIRVTRVSHTIEYEITPIEYTTKTIEVQTIAKGTRIVETPGEAGESVVAYSVQYRDGVECAREFLYDRVTKPPVEEVVRLGVGGSVTTSSGQTLSFSKYIDMKATAYTTEGKKWIYTFSGTVARVGAVAVDPKVIPLGSRLYIVSRDGKSWSYGVAVAEDTGVKGNIIDLFMNTYAECIQFGVRKCRVYVLD